MYRVRKEEIRRGSRGILMEEDEDEDEEQNNNNEGTIMEMEEFELLKNIKESKKIYRTHATEVNPLKQRLAFFGGVVDREREKLMNSFAIWYHGSSTHVRTSEGEESSEESSGSRSSRSKLLKSASACLPHQTQLSRPASKLAFARAQSQKWERESKILTSNMRK